MSCIWSNNFCNRCPRKLFCSKFWYNCETNDRNVSVKNQKPEKYVSIKVLYTSFCKVFPFFFKVSLSWPEVIGVNIEQLPAKVKCWNTEKTVNQVVSLSTTWKFNNILSWIGVHGQIFGEFRVVMELLFWKRLQSAEWSTQLRRSGGSKPAICCGFGQFRKELSITTKV